MLPKIKWKLNERKTKNSELKMKKKWKLFKIRIEFEIFLLFINKKYFVFFVWSLKFSNFRIFVMPGDENFF